MNRLACPIFTMLFFLLSNPAHVFAQADILNLRHWASPEHTRVVIDTSKEVEFTVEKSDGKVLLKLKDTALLKTLPCEFILNQPGITRVALFPLPEGNVGIEFFLAGQVETNIFKLKKFQDKPDRVVMDIVLPEVEKEKSRAREQVKVSRKDKIVVIDPGHGGEDPGAIGYLGANEKDLVLEISRKVRDTLNAGEGARAFLTREGDYYVSFKKRLSIAREFGADLFLSIHADAARNRKAKGSSVYCLSTGGAGSEAARILARKENMADIVGGTLGEGGSNGESDPIILDMFQTNTMNRSKSFGSKILGNLCRVNDIKFPSVQGAPFMVLKLPEIPAVLIETAYISNPHEERKLKTGKFQMEIAQAISGSVRDFFSLPAPAAPALRTSVHKVKKDDTLTRVAAMYDTEVAVLLKMNKMKLKDTLYIGRMLVVPLSGKARKDEKTVRKAAAPGQPLKTKPAIQVYKVKKGDTLDKIARKYHTNVAALLKLNRMKMCDPLYVDCELKVGRQTP